MKQKAKHIISILIIPIAGILFFCLTPPANYGEWAVQVGVIIASMFVLCLSAILVIALNLKDHSAIIRGCIKIKIFGTPSVLSRLRIR